MTSEFLTQVRAIVGESGLTVDATDMAPYLEERRGLYVGKAAAIVRPGSTQEVAGVMGLAHETGTIVVPQGGNNGSGWWTDAR